MPIIIYRDYPSKTAIITAIRYATTYKYEGWVEFFSRPNPSPKMSLNKHPPPPPLPHFTVAFKPAISFFLKNNPSLYGSTHVQCVHTSNAFSLCGLVFDTNILLERETSCAYYYYIQQHFLKNEKNGTQQQCSYKKVKNKKNKTCCKEKKPLL